MKSGLIALAMATALAALPGTASASDHCRKGPFNGVYIGASAGYVGADAEQTTPGLPRISSDDAGVILGGHLGYNLQCGRLVLGIEGDFNYVDLSSSGTATDQTTLRSSLDWLATLRGRLGVTVHPDLMLYATGGFAWADRTHAVADPGTVSGITFSQSDSDTATGWVAGGGIEFLRHERWLFRAEVLYVGLEDKSRTYSVTNPGCGGGVCTSDVGWKDDMIVARLGVSLKLGGHEPTYQPLK